MIGAGTLDGTNLYHPLQDWMTVIFRREIINNFIITGYDLS